MSVIKFLSDLVKEPSLSGEEGEIASIVKEEISKLGVDEVRIDRVGNVIARIERSGDCLILLDAHMDTVPAGDREAWRRDPFSGEIVDGHVYGRGSVDTKGSLAAIVHSIPLLSERGPDLVYAFVVHEEDHEGFGVRHAMNSIGSRPDLVIIGEPTSLNIARGHRGRAEVLVEFRGRAAHSSMPELGVNCLDELCEYLRELNKIEMPSHPLLGSASVSPIRVDVSPGLIPMIPDYCTLLLDRRTLPGESKSDIEEQLRGRIVRKIVKCYTGYEEEAEAWFPAWINEEPFINRLASELGADVILWRFGTDGSHTAGETGISTIGYGPGDQEVAHRPDEMIRIDEVERAVKGYAKIVNSLPYEF